MIADFFENFGGSCNFHEEQGCVIFFGNKIYFVHYSQASKAKK